MELAQLLPPHFALYGQEYSMESLTLSLMLTDTEGICPQLNMPLLIEP